MAYSDITFRDPNPLKRRLQNLRINHAYKRFDLSGKRVLDFGGGNGHLLKSIIESGVSLSQADLFEPAASLMQEAKENLKDHQIHFFSDTNHLNKKYDFIFCLEVLEHLTEKDILKTLETLKSCLQDGGTIVVGVPNEIYFVALLKGIFRLFKRPNDYDTSLWRIFSATLGWPPKDRPIREIGAGLPYCFYHMGFDYRQLRKYLGPFKKTSVYGSPFTSMPLSFNSEVFFILN